MAAAILSWSARYCNRLGWAYGTYTETLNPTGPTDTFSVSALPLDTAQAVTVSYVGRKADTPTPKSNDS